jgi:hypothetical protein
VNNRWSSHASAEPAIEWVLSFPDEGPAARRTIAAEVLAAGDATGLFTIARVDVGDLQLAAATNNDAWRAVVDQRGLDHPLPFQDALLEGEGTVEVETTVAVRDHDGAIVEKRASDAGALLRELEPGLSATDARRFAGHKPFVAPWAVLEGGRFEVRFGFWTDLFWLRVDDELRAKNEARLVDLRERLQAIARARKGEASLPVPAHKQAPDR